MSCIRMRDTDVMERYLQGGLDPSEREAFEEHYFDCDDCFERLEVLRDVRDTLLERSKRGEDFESVAAGSWWTPWRLAAAAALALAVIALGALSLWERSPVSDELAALARIEPPAYEPAVLRRAEGDADRRFAEAMEHYVAGDFGAAASGLEQVARLDPGSPRIQFFLGASYLLTDRTEPGISALERAIALGDSPYFEEAHLLLAKARLRQGDRDNALQALEETIALEGDLETEARDLLDRLHALP